MLSTSDIIWICVHARRWNETQYSRAQFNREECLTSRRFVVGKSAEGSGTVRSLWMWSVSWKMERNLCYLIWQIIRKFMFIYKQRMNFSVLVNLLIKIFQISLMLYVSSDEVGWLSRVTWSRFTAGVWSHCWEQNSGVFAAIHQKLSQLVGFYHVLDLVNKTKQ